MFYHLLINTDEMSLLRERLSVMLDDKSVLDKFLERIIPASRNLVMMFHPEQLEASMEFDPQRCVKQISQFFPEEYIVAYEALFGIGYNEAMTEVLISVTREMSLIGRNMSYEIH